jgi:hypothetical protein
MSRSGLRALYLCTLLASGSAAAHHSYAMFDESGTRTLNGTVAKLEWKNPHSFIWVYVPNPAAAGKYDLWAFENGSPSVLLKHGWDKNSFKAGDKVTVEYWPLRSGGNGGHCEKVTSADGKALQCPSDLGRR